MDIPAGNPNIPNPNPQEASLKPEGLNAAQPERQPQPSAAEVPAVAPVAPQNTGMPAQAASVPAVTPGLPLAVDPNTPATPLPNVASDVDVIEPEWVEKAEEVVRSHQGDPYGEEEAIETLQEDYLKKRYGFQVAQPDADSTKPGPG